jgi:hypothetical protein
MASQDEPRGGSAFERQQRRTEHLRSLLDEIEKRRQQAESEGLNFTAPTTEQLEEKLRRAQSPFIWFQGWSGSAPRDGTLSYTVGVTNPDPDPWIWLFAHVFVGRANLPRSVGEAVAAVDTRFPQLTEPEFAGLTLPAFANDSLTFSIEMPAGAEPSNYLGNTFVFQATWHDPAVYLDRSLFVFELT